MRGALLLGLALAIPSLLLGDSQARSGTPIPIETLFDGGDVLRAVISPSGKWTLVHLREAEGRQRLLAQRIGLAPVEVVPGEEDPIREIRWVDGDTFVLALDGSEAGRRVVVALIESGDRIAAETRSLRGDGWLVDPLIRDESTVLWGFEQDGFTKVHRAPFEQAIRFDPEWQEERAGRGRVIKRRMKLGREVVRVEGRARSFVLDREGAPRAALRLDEDSTTLLYRDSGEGGFRELVRFEDEEDRIEPHAMAPDGKSLLVLAYGGRGTVSLFELDPSRASHGSEEPAPGRFRLGEPLFSLDDADLTDVLIDDATRELVGVAYDVDGESRHHYFDAYRDRHLAGIERRFPGEDVAVASASADHSAFVLWISGPTSPGTWYFHARGTAEFVPIARRSRDLDRELLHDVEVLEVDATDPQRLETFLVMPEAQTGGPAPLVVIPHGGPIGFGDDLAFDPLQQYLASWGLATLKVHYRSSPGSGPELREAGGGDDSRGLEDDIDSAVRLVLNRPDVDASRVCVVGGSFGGYSALVSVLRHPERYRCAAALNGVTDLPFQFESSELAGDENLRERFAAFVGDPDEDLQALVERSPLYNSERLRTPLLLVYGTEDRQVDPDHSYRLMAMLDIHGREYEQWPVDGAGHSFTTEQWTEVASTLRRFLLKHLVQDGEAPAPSSGSARDAGAGGTARSAAE